MQKCLGFALWKNLWIMGKQVDFLRVFHIVNRFVNRAGGFSAGHKMEKIGLHNIFLWTFVFPNFWDLNILTTAFLQAQKIPLDRQIEN